MPSQVRARLVITSSLSAAQIEQRLGLPFGAARRRRLFVVTVLRTTGDTNPLRRGDRLIVEPGVQTAPGRAVLCAHGEFLSLGRVRLDAHGEAVVTSLDCGGLPLPTTPTPRVLGTIIARLPSRPARRPHRPAVVVAGSAMPSPPRQSEAAAAAAQRVARLAQLNAQLNALRRCLNRVGDERLQHALERETVRTESALQRVLARPGRPRPSLARSQ